MPMTPEEKRIYNNQQYKKKKEEKKISKDKTSSDLIYELVYECFINHLQRNNIKLDMTMEIFEKEIICINRTMFKHRLDKIWNEFSSLHHRKQWVETEYNNIEIQTIRPYELFEPNDYKTIFHFTNLAPKTRPYNWNWLGHKDCEYWRKNVIFKDDFCELYPKTQYIHHFFEEAIDPSYEYKIKERDNYDYKKDF